jgi:pilus assembly protein Flp/PilA
MVKEQMNRLVPAERSANRPLSSAAGWRMLVARFVADQRGATAIEYAMIAAGIGVAVSTAVWSLGTAVKTTFYDKMTGMFD